MAVASRGCAPRAKQNTREISSLNDKFYVKKFFSRQIYLQKSVQHGNKVVPKEIKRGMGKKKKTSLLKRIVCLKIKGHHFLKGPLFSILILLVTIQGLQIM